MEDESRDNSETTANSLEEEDQNVCPKRSKVDGDLSNDELSVIQPEIDHDDSCGEDITVHSTDDDIGDSRSEDEIETGVTNRELQEVIQDVARKRCRAT